VTAVVGDRPPGAGPETGDLDALLNPRSVALVGATERSAWSVNAHANLRRFSPHVRVHCVAPRGGQVHGQEAHVSLADLPEAIDLAYVMTPRETVPDMIRGAAAAGAKAVVVLTAGFGELADGGSHQQALVDAAHESDVVLLGPNGGGLLNLNDGVVAFGLHVPELPAAGPAAFVLHSGGLIKPVLSLCVAWGVGVAGVVSSGNEAALTAAQLAAHQLEDDRVGAVGLFLETVRDPEEFRALAARAVALDKPIVALTVGRSEVAQRAAVAHTGALAGDAAATSAALAALGIIEVRSLEELVATTALLSRGFRPAGRRLGVVGASGGAGELLAERATDVGLTLPPLDEAARSALTEVLPDISSAQNPLDVTGIATSDPSLPLKALARLASGAEHVFDALVFQAFVLPGDVTDPDLAARQRERFAEIAAAVRDVPVPVVLQDPVSAPLSRLAREILAAEDLIRVPGTEHGLAAVGHAATWVARSAELMHRQPPAPRDLTLDERLVGRALTEAESLDLVARAGVPVVPHVVARTADEAVAAAAGLGGPVAMKVSSVDVQHKSDVGGVRLGVWGDDAVAAAYEEITSGVAAAQPDARLDGVLLAPMRSGGVELVVGVNRDAVWGPVLVLGLGGVFVEVFGDVALRPLPLGRADVLDMLAELRAAPLLRGARGTGPVDVEAVVDAVLALADVAHALGDSFQSLEINPLRSHADGAEALDCLVVWRDPDLLTPHPQHGGDEA